MKKSTYFAVLCMLLALAAAGVFTSLNAAAGENAISLASSNQNERSGNAKRQDEASLRSDMLDNEGFSFEEPQDTKPEEEEAPSTGIISETPSLPSETPGLPSEMPGVPSNTPTLQEQGVGPDATALGRSMLFPLALGSASITVTGVPAGGLATAVTEANGGSSDFSGLLELHVSGLLNTSDFYFLQGLPNLQMLDLAGCGVSAMNAIPGALFRNHTNLVAVTMPGLGGYVIPSNLFTGCTALVYADVSRALNFGSAIFSGCSSLQTPVMPSTYIITSSMFENCTSLTSFDASKAGVIEGSAFYGCTSLTSINLLGAQKTIKDYAFWGCSALNEVKFATGTQLGSYVFANCTSLTGVNLAGVKLTGAGAFWSCTGLQGFTPTADGNLPAYTFGNCSALVSADLTSFRSFGEGAFSGCSSLQSVAMPASYALAPSLFQNCSALVSFDLSGATALARSAFASCLSLKEVRMPLAPYAIPDSTFVGCSSLEQLDLSGAVSVGQNAFNSCIHLYDITWPAGGGLNDATLGDYAFALTAQDFSKGFPTGSGLTGTNDTRIAPSQTPRVYFLLTDGSSGSIVQGDPFPAPWALRTQFGTDYAEMCSETSFDSWRVFGLQPPPVSADITLDGAPVAEVDTNVTGVYSIRYSIPGGVFANNYELAYTLVVTPKPPTPSGSPLPSFTPSASPVPSSPTPTPSTPTPTPVPLSPTPGPSSPTPTPAPSSPSPSPKPSEDGDPTAATSGNGSSSNAITYH